MMLVEREIVKGEQLLEFEPRDHEAWAAGEGPWLGQLVVACWL